MSTTLAMTAVNASLAAQSAANASRARAERCKAELLQYTPKSASVAEMQSYASCVQTLYPTDDDTAAIKFCVGAVLAAVLIGALIGGVRGGYDWVAEAMMGAIVSLCAVTGLLLVIGAVVFLLS